MAARSIESLTIALGLVAIPVKLYPATVSSERLRFHLLHEKDGSRLKQQYVCVEEQEVVGRDEIVKGYEFAKGQYVMFTGWRQAVHSLRHGPARERTLRCWPVGESWTRSRRHSPADR